MLWHNWCEIHNWGTHLREGHQETHVEENQGCDEKQAQVKVIAIVVKESDVVS